jgi:hypothetical protein
MSRPKQRPFRLLATLIFSQSDCLKVVGDLLSVNLGELSRLTKIESFHLRRTLTQLKDWGFLSFLSLEYGRALIGINIPPKPIQLGEKGAAKLPTHSLVEGDSFEP